jgi:hypothetical protein
MRNWQNEGESALGDFRDQLLTAEKRKSLSPTKELRRPSLKRKSLLVNGKQTKRSNGKVSLTPLSFSPRRCGNP